MSFSSRHGYRRPLPPRTIRERVPDGVLVLVRADIIDEWGELGAYRRMCEVLGEVPSSDVWSDAGARWVFDSVFGGLTWFEALDLLEEASTGADDERVNGVFARYGLAYEMVDGEIGLWDPEGEELGITGVEFEVEEQLAGRFQAVRAQYKRALDALHGRPADLEKAVSESVGALEAVVHVITGEKDFGKAIDKCLADRESIGALRASLKQLYGWASQLPGARHGRHAEPDVTFDDAFFAVRACAVAIAYLINTNPE